MASHYNLPPDDPYESTEPQPHPYLHEALLYISGLPHHVTDENLALAFTTCAPFRPHITRDSSTKLLSGTIEFKALDKRVFLSRKGACHASRAPDPWSNPSRPSHTLAISPNYSPHPSSSPERVSASRKASSAKLRRFPTLRSLPSVWRTRFGAHPGQLR
jgi:polyadenylate-binding protein